jgi:hypothetical protein
LNTAAAKAKALPARTLRGITGHYDQLRSDLQSCVGNGERAAWVRSASGMIDQYTKVLEADYEAQRFGGAKASPAAKEARSEVAVAYRKLQAEISEVQASLDID